LKMSRGNGIQEIYDAISEMANNYDDIVMDLKSENRRLKGELTSPPVEHLENQLGETIGKLKRRIEHLENQIRDVIKANITAKEN
jgi:regulator of replication initiation timing